MPDNVIEKILKDMDEQGFPLEVRVTEILKTHGWHVQNQETYFDAETGKQRTVDIVSIKDARTLEVESRKKYTHDWAFQVRLFVECKKSIKPWVFYASEIGKDQIEESLSINAQIHTDKVDRLIYPKDSHDAFDRTDTDGLHRFTQELARPALLERLASIAYEPFTNGKGHSIHKARIQVCSALIYLKHKLEQDTPEILLCTLLKPVIIFDGRLYVYKDQNLTECEGLYYSVSHDDSRFLIEIVTVDFLHTYLERIENNIGNFERSFKAKDK